MPSLIRSFGPSLTLSLTGSLTNSLGLSLGRSFGGSLIGSLVNSLGVSFGSALGCNGVHDTISPMALRGPSRQACIRATWPSVNITMVSSST